MNGALINIPAGTYNCGWTIDADDIDVVLDDAADITGGVNFTSAAERVRFTGGVISGGGIDVQGTDVLIDNVNIDMSDQIHLIGATRFGIINSDIGTSSAVYPIYADTAVSTDLLFANNYLTSGGNGIMRLNRGQTRTVIVDSHFDQHNTATNPSLRIHGDTEDTFIGGNRIDGEQFNNHFRAGPSGDTVTEHGDVERTTIDDNDFCGESSHANHSEVDLMDGVTLYTTLGTTVSNNRVHTDATNPSSFQSTARSGAEAPTNSNNSYGPLSGCPAWSGGAESLAEGE